MSAAPKPVLARVKPRIANTAAPAAKVMRRVAYRHSNPAIPAIIARSGRRPGGERSEVDVLEVGGHGFEAGLGGGVGQDLDARAPGMALRGEDGQRRAIGVDGLALDRLAPHAPRELVDEAVRLALEQHAPAGEDGETRAELAHVLDDVGGQHDDHALADLAEQVVEAMALLGVEARPR